MKSSFFTTKIPSKEERVIINDKYMLKSLIKKNSNFCMYEGVDLTAHKLVLIYLKSSKMDFPLSQRVKPQLRTKISPSILWSGDQKIDHVLYNIEVHQKYGPCLKTMFDYLKDSISEKDFFLLFYQLIRLVQKYGTAGYIYRELDDQNIVFDPRPKKNQLFLLNVFPLKRKSELGEVVNSRFCSRGAHLGLKTNIKDDLESLCYILINIYTQGKFLKDVAKDQYLEAKTNFNFSSFSRPFPEKFIHFYNFAIGLNYDDDPHFFIWKSIVRKQISKQALLSPYHWMTIKQDESINQSAQDNMEEVDSHDEVEDELSPEDEDRFSSLCKHITISSKP